MEGKLDIVGRDEIKKMVSTSIPLLRAGGQCRKVILTPAGRYRYTPCCTTVGGFTSAISGTGTMDGGWRRS
jgi:hypothetical protein